jgi:hypothetical protein
LQLLKISVHWFVRQYLLFPIILSKFTTELGLTRATKAVDNKALLGVAVLLGRCHVEHVFEFLQLKIATSEDVTDGLREIKMLIEGYQ